MLKLCEKETFYRFLIYNKSFILNLINFVEDLSHALIIISIFFFAIWSIFLPIIRLAVYSLPSNRNAYLLFFHLLSCFPFFSPSPSLCIIFIGKRERERQLPMCGLEATCFTYRSFFVCNFFCIFSLLIIEIW